MRAHKGPAFFAYADNRLGRLRLRGPRGAQDEFVLAAIAQNLRRLAKLETAPTQLAPQPAPA